MPFAWSNGANLTKDGGKAYSFDTPEMQEAAEVLPELLHRRDLRQGRPGDADRPSRTSSAARSPMFISGPWEMSAVEKVGGKGFKDKYSVVQMPDEEDVLLLRRWLRLRGLQELQEARHRLEVREVPLRPQDAGQVVPAVDRPALGHLARGRTRRSALTPSWRSSASSSRPPRPRRRFPTWEQVVAAVRHRDGEGHQAGQRPGGRAEVRADAGAVDRDRPDPMTTTEHAPSPQDGPGRSRLAPPPAPAGAACGRGVPPGSSPCRSALLFLDLHGVAGRSSRSS